MSPSKGDRVVVNQLAHEAALVLRSYSRPNWIHLPQLLSQLLLRLRIREKRGDFRRTNQDKIHNQQADHDEPDLERVTLALRRLAHPGPRLLIRPDSRSRICLSQRSRKVM